MTPRTAKRRVRFHVTEEVLMLDDKEYIGRIGRSAVSGSGVWSGWATGRHLSKRRPDAPPCPLRAVRGTK